jgi:hypothetical protein
MDNTFDSCYNFNQNISIPNSVTSMSGTFDSCYNFNQNISIPNSVINMDRAFYNCTNLKEVNIYSNKIQNLIYSFFNCVNLNNFNSVAFDNATDISYAFSNCYSLNANTLHFTNYLTSSNKAFYNCSNIRHIYIDKVNFHTISFSGDTFWNCTNAKISFPDVGIVSASSGDFYNIPRICCNNTEFLNNAITNDNWDALSIGAHSFQDKGITKEPTCTEEGKQEAQCIYCDYPRIEIIPALGHDYDENGICSRCDIEDVEDAYNVYRTQYNELLTYSIEKLTFITKDELNINLYPEFNLIKDSKTQLKTLVNDTKELETYIKQALKDNIGTEEESE